MGTKTLIAPSILSADFGKLADEIRDVERCGADVIHIDVMDGAFVPNITIGPLVVRAARAATRLPLDVHLMISEPVRFVNEFRAAGADWITVHVEACRDLDATLTAIERSGAHAGISLKPATPLDAAVLRAVSRCYLVLVMSVEPGFGGQAFMEHVVPKIKELRAQYQGVISVDGGITPETAAVARAAGVDLLVAGTAVFGAKNRKKAIEALRK